MSQQPEDVIGETSRSFSNNGLEAGNMTQASRSTVHVAVIMPTYNERDNIVPITTRVRSAVPEADLLIVDDNSPDMTGQIAEELAAADSHIHVLHRQSKAGLGAAYIAGFRWALDRHYDVLVEMDADGSHQPEELPRLLRALDGADLVLGSRWVPGGQVLNWPRSRRILSRAGNAYARWVLGISLNDVTGGYRVYRASALPKIGLENVQSQGYCFQIDLVRRALGAGLTLAEIPITFMERTRGKSKMSTTIVREAIWMVTQWGIAERLPRYFRQERWSDGRAGRGRPRADRSRLSTAPIGGPSPARGLLPAVPVVDGRSPWRPRGGREGTTQAGSLALGGPLGVL
jgi:dolichol-phosphate mannosyltransferase